MSDEVLYAIALSMLPGGSVDSYRSVLDEYDSLREYFGDADGAPGRYGAEAVAAVLKAAEAELGRCRERNIRPVAVGTDGYPQRLALCDDAPAVLYMCGDVDLNASHVVSIVGTRHVTSYGRRVTGDIVRGLSASLDNLVIVSGLAFGVDVAAHMAAIECGVPTVGVLAHGLDHIYPAQHTDMARQMIRRGLGAVCSEYRIGAPTHKSSFLARNRIVAALSDCTVVVESAIRGGALSTARRAAENGRMVFAVPGRVYDTYSEGCNDMIARHKAVAVSGAEDIMEAMMWEGCREAALPLLNEREQAAYDVLCDRGSATAAEVAAAMERPLSTVMPLLVSMQMKQHVTVDAKGVFEPAER